MPPLKQPKELYKNNEINRSQNVQVVRSTQYEKTKTLPIRDVKHVTCGREQIVSVVATCSRDKRERGNSPENSLKSPLSLQA